MAASFALRIHVPARPQRLFLHFRGTPLRLDTVTASSSSGPTRAVEPRRSTTTWASPPISSSSARGNGGTSAATQPDLPTSDDAAGASRRLPSALVPSSSSSSETGENHLLAQERNRKPRRKLQQQTEASRFSECTRVQIDTSLTPPRAVPVEPVALVGACPIAPDLAIGSFKGRLNAVQPQLGSREEKVAPDAAHGGPEDARNAPGTAPVRSTRRPPGSTVVDENRRQSLASDQRTAMAPANNNNEAAAALTVRCQCGNVSFSTPAMAPLALYHCHCTECQKQSASAFGTSALYPADALFPLADGRARALKCWTRPTDSGGRMHCYFCPQCGSRLFHRIENADGTPRATVSLKAGCVEGLDLRGAAHIYTRSAVVDIPEGAKQYAAAPDDMPRDPCLRIKPGN